MAKNSNLSAAKRAKKDEFYTQLSDIENELRHYRKHFKDKVVLCNCDDPYESNFFKFFALNFNYLGLKKLIATCYVNSPIAGEQMALFDVESSEETTKKPHKIVITKVDDANGDSAVDMADVEWLLKNGSTVLTELEGNGDFRSEECKALMEEADIVVTNPPFSLFREFVAQLMAMNKKFLIIGNSNAVSYKEIFPLIQSNKLWLGITRQGTGSMWFRVPDDFPEKSGQKTEDGIRYQTIGHSAWFTNMDHPIRHEDIDLYKSYTPKDYPNYDNYDAIEVNKVAEIPDDYEECYLVPIKYKQDLINAGYKLGYERLNSKGEPCVSLSLSLSLSLSGENRSTGTNGVLQRCNGSADNVSGQVQPRSVRDSRTRQIYGRQSEAWSQIYDKWEREIRQIIGPQTSIEYCSGVMGVPITFMGKYNPDQFEIVDINPHFFVLTGRGLPKPKQLSLKGAGKKDPYARLLIRRKHTCKQENHYGNQT